VMDAPLAKRTTSSGEKVVFAERDGKSAVTHFIVRKRFRDMTLLEVTLETGRTHQIRVHCQLAGYPLLGDDKYGDEEANRSIRDRGLKRMFLHAHRLTFPHPVYGEKISVESPLPEDLQRVAGL